MKKPILVPLLSSTFLIACHESNNVHADAEKKVNVQKIEQQQIKALWVGKYQGVTPCESCITRCDGCEGTAVEIMLKPDMQYELVTQSLSGEHEPQSYQGKLYFKDKAQTELKLLNLKVRHELHFDQKQDTLEILDDQTQKPYISKQEFILEKVV